MRHVLLLALLLQTFLISFSQLNEHLSIIVGPGASLVTGKIYETPAVNPTNNQVFVEDGPRIKTNITIGLTYTPYKYNNFRTELVPDEFSPQGYMKRNVIETVTEGLTFGVFLNPISLSNATQTQPFFNMTDFGLGIGRKGERGAFFLFTIEYFGVRQPRQWFIDQFKDKNLTYTVAGAPQTSININDDNVFRNKGFITFGVKAGFALDIIRRFVTESRSIDDSGKDVTPQPKNPGSGGAPEAPQNPTQESKDGDDVTPDPIHDGDTTNPADGDQQ